MLSFYDRYIFFWKGPISYKLIIFIYFLGNLLAEEQPRPTYSALVGTVSSGPRGRGAVYKKALASKMKSGTISRNGNANGDDFKVT